MTTPTGRHLTAVPDGAQASTPDLLPERLRVELFLPVEARVRRAAARDRNFADVRLFGDWSFRYERNSPTLPGLLLSWALLTCLTRDDGRIWAQLVVDNGGPADHGVLVRALGLGTHQLVDPATPKRAVFTRELRAGQ